MFACVFIYKCVSVSKTQTVRGSMCVSPFSVCALDVDCMYYADQGEPCAINKTGLQCAHWRNNLSDTMENRERGRKAQTERVGETQAGIEDR